MAPSTTTRFDDIDTSSSDDDEDGDGQARRGRGRPDDQLFDFFRARRAENAALARRPGHGDAGRAMYRSDPLNNSARPRRRLALVEDDPNDICPPIFTERKKSNSRATEKGGGGGRGAA